VYFRVWKVIIAMETLTSLRRNNRKVTMAANFSSDVADGDDKRKEKVARTDDDSRTIT
jgi:hypothetical protein